MSYDLFDIAKPDASNPGTGGGIKNLVKIALQSDVNEDQFPTSDADLVTVHNDLRFKNGKNWHTLYATPEEIDFKMNLVGERDGKGFEISLELYHPGRYSTFESFLAKFANENFYVKIEECTTGMKRIGGTPCSPMYIDTSESGYGKNATERKGTSIVFKCTQARPPLFLTEDSDSGI